MSDPDHPAPPQQEATARGDGSRVHGWTGSAEISSGETVTFHAHADKPPSPETAAALQRIVEVAAEQMASGCTCAGDELAPHCLIHDKDGIVTGEPASSQQEATPLTRVHGSGWGDQPGDEWEDAEEPAPSEATPSEKREWTIYVCPKCGEWADGTANGYPLYSPCEYDGHPKAEPVKVVRSASPSK
jgi:hypothetical protein